MAKKKRRKRSRIEFDDQFFIRLENAIANGCDTNKKMADAVGFNVGTFKNYRYGRGKSSKRNDYIVPIESTIKKGLLRRQESLIKISEDSLVKLVKGYSYEETTHEEQLLPDGRDDTGVELFKRIIKNKKVIKHIPPNAMATVFVAVNQGPDRWQSINKILIEKGDNRNGILGNINKMLEDKRKGDND